MIHITELSKNLPANMTKVLIDFHEIVQDRRRLIACWPTQFITRIYNIKSMINCHESSLPDGITEYLITFRYCRESYYTEDDHSNSIALYKPTTSITRAVNKEDYDQFISFRCNPLKYLNIQEEILNHRRVVRNPIMELEV